MVHYCSKPSLIPVDNEVLEEISLLLNEVEYSLSYGDLMTHNVARPCEIAEFGNHSFTFALPLIIVLL